MIDEVTAYSGYLVFPNLSAEEEKLLFSDRDDPENREKIIKSHLKLVVSISRDFSLLGYSEDLIQEGIVGLIEAVHRFKISGCRFSTFASFYIKNQIRSSLRKNTFLFTVPEKTVHEAFKIAEYIREHYQATGQNATVECLMDVSGYSKKKIKKLLELFDCGYITPPTKYTETDLDQIDNNLKMMNISLFLDFCDTKDKKILFLRYEEGMSWRNVAKTVRMSHEGCRKRHRKIIGLIREHFLRDFDDK
jgi:RNA polymerase sigma factor (sigma-70 family)